MSTPPSLFSSYSDASSSYWPPGWNFNRYVYATAEDDADLPAEERAKMQAGFHDVLGEDGVQEMARVVWQEQLRLKKLEESATASSSSATQPRQPPPPPDWLKTWRKRYAGGSWGFVAFCAPTATATTMPGSEMEEFRTRVREIIEIPFQEALEEGQPADDIAEMRRLFEIRWVDVQGEAAGGEEEEGEGGEPRTRGGGGGDWVDKARTRYRAMRESRSFPPGLFLSVFLCATPEAMASVLRTSPGEVKEAHAAKPRWRSSAPFLLVAVAEVEQGVEDDDEDPHLGGEKSWFKPVFKAAAEVVVDELWWVVAEQMTTLGSMTRFVRGATVTDAAKPAEEEEEEGEEQGVG